MQVLAKLFRKSPWLLGLLTFIVIVLSILPTATQWGLSAWLSKHTQAPAHIDNIDFNLFTGRLTIENIALQNQNQPLQIDHFSADLSMRSLLDGKLLFENASLKGVQLPIQRQTENSELLIAGFKLPQKSNAEESATALELPIAIGIESLHLQNIHLNLSANETTHQFQILDLKLTKLYSWDQNFGRLILDSELDKKPINANLQLHLFAKQPKIVGTLTAKDLNLQDAQDWLPSEIQSFQGTASIDSTFTLEQTVNGLALYQRAELGINNFEADIASQNIRYQSFSWKGDTHLFVGETKGLKLQGETSINDFQAKLSSKNENAPTPQTLAVDLNSQINLNAQLDNDLIKIQQTGPIRLNNLSWNNDQQKLTTQSASFDGELLWDASSQTLNANGDLNVAETEFQDSLQQLATSLSAKLNLKVLQNTTGLSISQKGNIGLSDFEFQTDAVKQNLSKFNWQGDLNIQTQSPETIPAGKESQANEISIQATGNVTLNDSLTELPPSGNSSSPDSTPIRIKQNFASAINLVSQITPETINIDLKSDSKLSNISLEQNSHTLKAQQIAWQDKTIVTIPNSKSETPESQIPQTQLQLSTQVSLEAEQLELMANRNHPMVKTNTPIISLAKLNVEHIRLPDSSTIKLTQPSLQNLNVFNSQQSGKILSIQQSQVDQINLSLKPTINVEVGHILLQGVSGNLKVNQDKSLQEITVLQQSLLVQTEEKAQKTPTPEATKTNDSPPQIALADLTMTGNNQLKLSIQEGNKLVEQNLTFNRLHVGSINTSSPDFKTPYELKLNVGEFGMITSKGEMSPLASPLYLITNTKIDGLSLLEYSPLAENNIGYQIESGQLSAKISGSLNQRIIDLSNSIDLSKFTLTKASNNKSEDFDKNFQMPLNVGLSLLKDKQDNIHLKLPIKGDLNNPNFNATDIVGKALNGALGKATRAYLLLALQPFGALAMAGEFAFDKMSAVKLESIVFEAASPQLSTNMQRYLDKVSTLLAEKSKLQIKLCTGANEQDRNALKQINAKPSKETTSSKQNSTQSEIVKISDNELLKLAKQRQNAIKQYLIKHGVKGSQIILCQPKISPAKGLPVVEMGI